jgi:hypothetical protein
VERLAAMIPPGQPILVGHHSERRARRDALRIENGMKRAVMLFERAEYWEERARSALLHAKYKERPDVRWRRIKKIEADLRKAEKTIAQSQKYLTMWRAESLDLNMAKLISSHDHISACFPLDTYPRPAEKSQYEGSRSLWSALDDDIITTEQAREIAIRCHERQIQHQQRWVNHYQNRLIYERAMLDESGGVVGGRRSGMNARSQALVPLSTEQQAAWRAVAETEKRRHQGNTLAEYPYAGAFFRCLNGSRRISLSDLRFFMPSLTAEELRGNRSQWLYAVDVLIETQGEVCLLPLPGDAAEQLFPSVRFRVRERSRHKSALVMQKYSRQQAREAEQKTRAYQALVAQAEIELAFHSPETVGSWHARWSDRVAEHDLETLFWQWGERFSSLAGMERWQWQDMPFWQVITEAGMAAREAGHAVREMERWMVPNKLREAA